MKDSLSDVTNRIFDLELKWGLLDYQINGIPIWLANRMDILYLIAQSLQIFEKPHTVLSDYKKSHKIKILLGYLKNSIFFNPFWNCTGSDILIFDHARSKSVNNQFVDIYTHDFIGELKSNEVNHTIIESPFEHFHLRKPGPNKKYLDNIKIKSQIYSKYESRKISFDQLKFIDSLSKEIELEFGINFDFKTKLINSYGCSCSRYKLFDSLLRKIKPKAIFVLISYAYFDLITAARRLDIPVYELQHGTINKFHLGYSYPYQVDSTYFPNKILVWGDYWKEIIENINSPMTPVVTGFNYFNNERTRRFENIKENQSNSGILVISQGALTEEIAKTIFRDRDKLSEYKVFYKLHPSEYRWWKRSETLVKLSHLDNFTILDYNADLYDLFSQCPIVVGVFSTAIYEAIGFGCRPFLIDLPGIEYMKDLLDRGFASPYDICKIAKSTKLEKNKVFISEYLFANDMLSYDKFSSITEGEL